MFCENCGNQLDDNDLFCTITEQNISVIYTLTHISAKINVFFNLIIILR